MILYIVPMYALFAILSILICLTLFVVALRILPPYSIGLSQSFKA